MNDGRCFTRRQFLRTTATFGLLAGIFRIAPAYAWQQAVAGTKSAADGQAVDISVLTRSLAIGERHGKVVTLNGSVPGPLLRFREGQNVVIRVTNRLEEDTSIHWHGMLVPPEMDGVPGVSFAGIRPGETFVYRFPVRQNGTYWYHSHSAVQEQLGHYGPLIIDPAEPEPFAYDREYVVMLSDWTFEDPHRILSNLKKSPGYYNFQKRTVGDLFRDASRDGWKATLTERLMWARMRMDATDIADVTGYTYTYLVNGLPPGANWTAFFRPGERVRLRFINAAAASYFDVRIPGLAMTVVQADGQNVQPVTVDEFRIAIAETYDVIVEPKEDRAYTLFAEAMDRSGYARGTLAPRVGISAPVPERRPRPTRTMADMGMADMGHGSGGGSDPHGGHGSAGGAPPSHAGMAGMEMSSPATGAGGESTKEFMHGLDHHGPGNSMIAMQARSRLHEAGTGLEDAGRRVLVYADLRSLTPGKDLRDPRREVELHLTGNMERFMWSFDGRKYSEAPEPIPFYYGERLRLVLVNDTMMDHPIHLHGMFMTLENGAGPHQPLKHTINVKPGERLSLAITADEPGNWAFHCHILYHMDAGMFRVVSVSQPEAEGGR